MPGDPAAAGAGAPPSAPPPGEHVILRRLRKSPLQRCLTLAVLEAMVVAGLSVVFEAWLVPLLQKRLGASAQLVGWLTIAPMFASGLLGPVASPIIAALGGNKRTALLTCWVQIAGLALLAAPLWLPGEAWAKPVGMAICIAIIGIGAVGGPAWMAWMGGMIPRHIRGRYHTGRLRLWTLMRLGFAVLFAVIMEHWKAGESAIGLQLVLGIGILSRVASWWLMRQQAELPPKLHPPGSSTGRVALQEARDFASFLRSIARTDLGKWTLVWATLHMGTMLAGPYFSYYWLLRREDGGLGLGDDYRLYTALLYTSTLTRMLAFPICGRLVDRFGSGAILRLAVIGITVIPLGHALSTSMPVLIATEVCSGLSWCMAESAVGVLLYSCSSDPLHRARLIGYHQSVVCIVIVVASFVGGWLIPRLPELHGSHYRSLFLLSAVLRLPAVVLALRLLPRLHGEAQVRGLWRLIPGAVPSIVLGRGVVRAFKE
jgi:MFS family permease